MQAPIAQVAPRVGAWARRATRMASPVLALVLLAPWSTFGQALVAPSPPSGEGGPRPGPRVAVGADVTLTIGPHDPHFFNYTDYEQNALRLMAATFGLSYRVAPRFETVGEVRLENLDRVLVSALYARVRPWASRPVTIVGGRVPPVFGAFSRARYGSANPLVSQPLAYQYLSTIRPDALPRSADALLAVRGRGWRVNYPAAIPPGAPARPGVPIVSTSRWDTGVVVYATTSRAEVAVGLTVGSLSDPRVRENNDGRQLAARVQWRPTAAWHVGVSAARGEFVDRRAAHAVEPARGGRQAALGVDGGFALDRFTIRGEVIHSTWALPVAGPPALDSPPGALAATVEVRYRLHPRLDVAARVDGLVFSDVTGTWLGGVPVSWDADVARVEAGGSIRLARRSRLKLVYQHDWRFGTRRTSRGFPAAQLAVWF